MLNHFRTLLLNWAGAQTTLDTPGAELVDPTFVPVNLPTSLQSVRTLLFGQTPDLAMLCYRARQLLCLVHTSPLEDYILQLDPRVSYDFRATPFVDAALYQPRVTTLLGTGTLNVGGTPAAPDSSGRMHHLLQVTLETDAEVRVERLSPPILKPLLNLAPAVPLTGTGYSFWIGQPAAGQMWQVEVYNRPQATLLALARAVASVGEPVLDALFNITPEEPYRSWRNLWFSNRELPLRLAALVCALVYRTEERRLAGG